VLIQENNEPQEVNHNKEGFMLRKFMVERTIPGASFLTNEEFRHLVKSGNEALEKAGLNVKWCSSYLTNDKLICILMAENEDLIWEHSRVGKLPIDSVVEVSRTIEPSITTMADKPYKPPRDEEVFNNIL
jgi:hypothetical protein